MKDNNYNKNKCPITETLPSSCESCLYPDYPICIYQRLIQLYDTNLINELTDTKRFLTLIDCDPYRDGVNNSFSTGGYTITSTTIKNDTLNLPGPGIYRISSSFISRFAPNDFIITPGSSVILEYSVIGREKDTVSITKALTVNIANTCTTNAIRYAQAITNIEVLYKTNEPKPSLRIFLSDFNFNASLNNKVTVSNMSLAVQKLQDL